MDFLGWGGEGAINLFKIGARMVLDVTVGAEAPILKRLIAVNTFVSPWGLEILGADTIYTIHCFSKPLLFFCYPTVLRFDRLPTELSGYIFLWRPPHPPKPTYKITNTQNIPYIPLLGCLAGIIFPQQCPATSRPRGLQG